MLFHLFLILLVLSDRSNENVKPQEKIDKYVESVDNECSLERKINKIYINDSEIIFLEKSACIYYDFLYDDLTALFKEIEKEASNYKKLLIAG